MAKDHPVSHVIGPTLRAYREEADFTQERLAFEAGVDRTFIGMIERDQRHVTINTVGNVIDALGVSWEELGRALDRGKRLSHLWCDFFYYAMLGRPFRQLCI